MSLLTKLFLYINQQNGESFITSVEKPDVKPTKVFYVINKNFRPLPPNTQMIGLTNTNFSTVGFSILYDINQESTLKFITWTRPVPHTEPIYITDDGKVSLENSGDGKKALYVLPNPVHTFVNDNFGNCLPKTDGGYTMVECIENLARKSQGAPTTIIEHFKDQIVIAKYKTKFLVLGTAIVLAIFLIVVYSFERFRK